MKSNTENYLDSIAGGIRALLDAKGWAEMHRKFLKETFGDDYHLAFADFCEKHNFSADFSTESGTYVIRQKPGKLQS